MYKALQLKFILLVCLVFVTSCSSPSVSVSGTPATDEEYEAAVKEAHDTMSVVRQALLSPKPSYVFIGLKIRVFGKGTFEDIWTEPLDFYNGFFTTQMVEGVTLAQGHHPEQMVRIPVEEVLDWMIVEEDGNLIGGYAIRLAYEHMTPDERVEFHKITGYVIK